MRALVLLLTIVVALSGLTALAVPIRAAHLASLNGPLVITPTVPSPNGTVTTTTPLIKATFQDSAGTIDTSTIYIHVDRANVTEVATTNITSTYVSYTPPSVLALQNGPHNVTVQVSDTSGNTAVLTWNFTVNTNVTAGVSIFTGIKPGEILLGVAVGAAIAGAIAGGFILYLKTTTRFTFRRYFAVHPVKTQYYVIYLPAVVAFLVLLLGLDVVYNTANLSPQAPDFVFVLAAVVALGPFGVASRREIARSRAFERAFAQFLFEMADAMRGGIDPAKALVELAKTHTNILRKPLRIAADGIRMGRPFETVLREMVANMRSPLVKRYAALIADATGVGGETATVIYRAAKDMDDFVKIEEEREKQLLLPVAVIYIAFGVLMAVLFALISIAPDLGTLSINFLGGNPLAGQSSSAATTYIPHLDPATLKERFFELMLINGLGTGAIIGAFTEGRARYGILHSLGLMIGTVVIFALFVPS